MATELPPISPARAEPDDNDEVIVSRTNNLDRTASAALAPTNDQDVPTALLRFRVALGRAAGQRRAIRAAKTAFQQYDSTKNGTLSKKEFSRAVHSLNLQTFTAMEVDEVYSLFAGKSSADSIDYTALLDELAKIDPRDHSPCSSPPSPIVNGLLTIRSARALCYAKREAPANGVSKTRRAAPSAITNQS
eukprot:SAG31_NODE_5629_length_2415_cov_0.883420_2_plen_190_part_00